MGLWPQLIETGLLRGMPLKTLFDASVNRPTVYKNHCIVGDDDNTFLLPR
jgi:hypothetical protein